MIGQRSIRVSEAAASIKTGASQSQRSKADDLAAYRSVDTRPHEPTHADDFESLLSALETKSSLPADEQNSLDDLPSSFDRTLEGAFEETVDLETESAIDDSTNELVSEPEYDGYEEQDQADGLIENHETNVPNNSTVAAVPMFEQNSQALTQSSNELPGYVASTIPISETAAKIAEELQKRARHLQEQRWQFSLPGLVNGQLTVTVEKLADHTWLVWLETDEEVGGKELLALQHRLEERMGQVSVRAPA